MKGNVQFVGGKVWQEGENWICLDFFRVVQILLCLVQFLSKIGEMWGIYSEGEE